MNKDRDYETFSKDDKQKVFDILLSVDYDILVSNGCPFIIKTSDLTKQGKILLNTHPTFLPHLRGATPLNGVFYNGYDFMGATTHYITDGIDSGNIIYQKKVDLTPDIDQGLVYFISFNLETEVFAEAIRILENHNYQYEGIPVDVKEGCYFNRTKDKQTINFESDDTELVIRKIKSFGIPSQGSFARVEDRCIIIYDGECIENNYLLNLFRKLSPGCIAHQYGDELLIKTIDGLIKVTKFKQL